MAGVRRAVAVSEPLTEVYALGLVDHNQSADILVPKGVPAGNVRRITCPVGSMLTGGSVVGKDKMGSDENQVFLPSTSEIQINFGAGVCFPAVFDLGADVSLVNGD